MSALVSRRPSDARCFPSLVLYKPADGATIRGHTGHGQRSRGSHGCRAPLRRRCQRPPKCGTAGNARRTRSDHPAHRAAAARRFERVRTARRGCPKRLSRSRQSARQHRTADPRLSSERRRPAGRERLPPGARRRRTACRRPADPQRRHRARHERPRCRADTRAQRSRRRTAPAAPALHTEPADRIRSAPDRTACLPAGPPRRLHHLCQHAPAAPHASGFRGGIHAARRQACRRIRVRRRSGRARAHQADDHVRCRRHGIPRARLSARASCACLPRSARALRDLADPSGKRRPARRLRSRRRAFSGHALAAAARSSGGDDLSAAGPPRCARSRPPVRAGYRRFPHRARNARKPARPGARRRDRTHHAGTGSALFARPGGRAVSRWQARDRRREAVKGAAAEALAAAYLQRQGLEIASRNYRCRFGEIDLIARDGKTLVFVEVRRRSSDAFGGAAASITADKRSRLLRTARHYLAHDRSTAACRFDAVLIRGEPPRIEWIRNAFGE
ncbi:MAG: YraN family protein [Burkholderiales bacterium]|nr:YraN family protein [Burkholderiales bacterium]